MKRAGSNKVKPCGPVSFIGQKRNVLGGCAANHMDAVARPPKTSRNRRRLLVKQYRKIGYSKEVCEQLARRVVEG